jgi:uncharacterized protein involved in type VI secretion and phage assembly
MAEKLSLKVTYGESGTPLLHTKNMSISQSIFSHHHCNILVPGESIHDKLDEPDKLFKKIEAMIGQDLHISWEASTLKETVENPGENSFDGVITDIVIASDIRDHVLVSISAKSPTILMDGVQDTNTYAEKSLDDLFNASIENNLKAKLKKKSTLSFTEKLPFTVQYNETDFNFISRLMYNHNEWFYYDGTEICLGLKKVKKDLSVKRIHSLDYSFSLSKPIGKVQARDYLKHKVMDIKGDDASPKESFAKKMHSESLKTFPANKQHFVTFPSFPDGEEKGVSKKFIEGIQKSRKTSRSNEGFVLNGTTDLSSMRVGDTLTLQGTVYDGEYHVTSVTHTANGADDYQNIFEAIPADSGIPSSISVKQPMIDSCVAIVTDNKDPEKLGRVKVQFDWGEAISPWIRMVLPHTGKGRGFYFVPEINDEVMVGFEMGRPEFPYVIGSVYNGKNKQDDHYHEDNQFKAIKTLEGNEIIFHDLPGEPMLTIRALEQTIVIDHKTQTISIYSTGDVKIDAEKNITFSSGEDFTIKSKGKFTLQAEEDITLDSKNGGLSSKVMKDIELEATGKYALKANTGITQESSAGNFEAKGLQSKVEGSVKIELKGAMAKLEGSAMTEVKGGLVKIN